MYQANGAADTGIVPNVPCGVESNILGKFRSKWLFQVPNVPYGVEIVNLKVGIE